MTTDYVDEMLALHADVADVYRICLPIAALCATSAYEDHWIPWDKDKRELWVRELPETCVNEDNHSFPWFVKGMRDYELQERFGEWYSKQHGDEPTACLVGIRTQESLNRWRAIHSDRNERKFNGLSWTLDMGSVVNAYPIFDWTHDDVWTCNARKGYRYNKLYDLFHMAGVPLGSMRVASPFHDCGIDNLKLYRVIDPNNWARMIGRVNGVNFAGIYGGTTAMGWRSIKLPQGHTWKTYMEFLLATLPESTRDGYRTKLEKSVEFWRNRGGCLSDSVIEKLAGLGIAFEVVDQDSYDTTKRAVRMEYQDDVDIAEFREIPTYKRMCVCIMKNDHLCKFMGFSLSKTETERRARAEALYSKGCAHC
jgi:predicted phosphoadenosine phosphosulfate sulfurtransferase